MSDLINREMEDYFLGACLVAPEVFAESTLAKTDFGIIENQLVYEAIALVYEETRTTDAMLVTDTLKKQGELNRVGGIDKILNIHGQVTETISAPWYAKEIQRLAQKRHLQRLLTSAAAENSDLEVAPADILAKLETFTETIGIEYKGLAYYTASELECMPIEDVKWFIPNFLPSGLTVLSGPPKIGKSFFCWNIAIAVATGGIAFSNIPIPDSRNVSYLSLEDPPALLKSRLKTLSDETLPSNIFIIDDMQRQKLDYVGLKQLSKHLDDTRSELLIVDTWKHVTPDYDIKGTSYDIDYANLIPIQKFANDRNIGVVLVTHNRKAADIENPFNEIQGSVGMQAGADTMMLMSHDSGSKMLHISGRRIPSNQYAFTIKDGIWQLEGDVQEYHVSALRANILQHLKEAGDLGLTAGDIADLTGKGDATIRQTLRRMVHQGQVYQPKKRGEYFYQDDDPDAQLSL